MKLGGQLLPEQMDDARRDPVVAELGALLFEANSAQLLLFAMRALTSVPSAREYERLRETLHNGQRAGLDRILDAAEQWKQLLDKDAVARRKGALLQHLVQLLVTARLGDGSVHPETRVEFSDGQQTAPFDVLGAPMRSNWEGLECKAGPSISHDQEAELTWAAKTAARISDPLLVAVVSSAARDSILPRLRLFTDAELIFFLHGDNLFSLRNSPPSERVRS